MHSRVEVNVDMFIEERSSCETVACSQSYPLKSFAFQDHYSSKLHGVSI